MDSTSFNRYNPDFDKIMASSNNSYDLKLPVDKMDLFASNKYEINFYKSNKSDRWWMEVPYPPDKNLKFERHTLIPCSYKDYEIACKDEIPDRWWQTYQKLY